MKESNQANEASGRAPLSFGQRAAGVSFNPSQSDEVGQIKSASAEFIDYLNNARNSTEDTDVKRMYSLAITDIQTAQMWAVKAATWELK